MGILRIRALLFGVYDRAPDFWKLPKAYVSQAIWWFPHIESPFLSPCNKGPIKAKEHGG